MKEAPLKPKVLRRIPSDDCVVVLGRRVEKDDKGKEKVVDQGESHHLHRGEWVEFMPLVSVDEMIQFDRLMTSTGAEVDKNFRETCDIIALHIVRWNWTDFYSKRYPARPTGAMIRSLHDQEVAWLIGAFRGHGPERKNGSAPSGNSS